MKSKIKNIATALILSGLFFIPVLCSAQNSNGLVDDNINKSQAEIEAIEEMLNLEAKFRVQEIFIKRSEKIENRVYAANSNIINEDRSQAEIEAGEELLDILIISGIPRLNQTEPIQANYHQSPPNSNIMALHFEEEIGTLQIIR